MTVRVSRQSAILIAAVTAALATPLAFAQGSRAHVGATIAGAHAQVAAHAEAPPPSTPTPVTPTSTEPAATNAATTDTMGAARIDAATSSDANASATAANANMATAATPASATSTAPMGSSAKRVNWSALDLDKDGKLSKAEAAPVQALGKVFDQADADKDGALSADEYKAYLAAHAATSRTKASRANHG